VVLRAGVKEPAFEIITPERTFVFVVATPQERLNWVKAVGDGINNNIQHKVHTTHAPTHRATQRSFSSSLFALCRPTWITPGGTAHIRIRREASSPVNGSWARCVPLFTFFFFFFCILLTSPQHTQHTHTHTTAAW
jgi:hypothetical protein